MDRAEAITVHKPDYSYEAGMVRRLKEWQELDKAIREKFSLADWYEQLVETGLEIENLIKELPPVTPTERTGWIPVSERLPEKNELVLVTVWNDVVIAWRNLYGGWESAEDVYGKGNVTAWRPLPEPYKGGDTE